MKKFGEGNTPFYAEDDIPENHPDELDHITDQFMNNVYGESKSLIESSGQQLKGATTEDLKQTAKAVFILSGKVGYFTSDSSTANTKVLKPYDNNIIIPDLSLLDGFEFKFLNKGTNTGNVTVIIEGTGQSQALPVLDTNANQIAVGDMKDGGMYSLRYFAALNAFMFFSVSSYTKTDADERYPLKTDVYTKTVADSTFTKPADFRHGEYGDTDIFYLPNGLVIQGFTGTSGAWVNYPVAMSSVFPAIACAGYTTTQSDSITVADYNNTSMFVVMRNGTGGGITGKFNALVIGKEL